jgi:hypothetical protein
VQRHLAAELLQLGLVARAFNRDQHADLAETRSHGVVRVSRDRALGNLEALHATRDHVLADGGDQARKVILHGLAAGDLGRSQLLDAVHVQAGLGDRPGGVLETLVARHEVGLGVHLHHGRGRALAVVANGGGDQAFGGHAVGLLGGLGQALGAQPVGRALDVAARLLQRLFAVHHAGAGALAQILHQRGRDLRHGLSPVIWEPAGAGCSD